MKIYLRAALFLCVIISASNAEEKNTPFAYPNAIFITQGPRNISSRDRVYSDSAKIQASANPIIRISGGISAPEKDGSLGGMSWRFVSRTEFGDIYLLIYEGPTGKKEATSVLFDGATDIIFKRGNWVLTITNKTA